uniref:Crumbs cell polarity complex component 1 n=1 Tax=Pavo cristatus TaxID=9049 RepID=A0A8C9EYG0_PAVCR
PQHYESLSMRNDSRCLSNSCQKNSTCITGPRDDICRCVDMSLDTMEEFCNKTSDPCSSNPCLQNATCLSSAGNLNFTCECPDGYSGTTCEIAISMCDTNPCEHGGTCLDGLARPTCLCHTGFTGTHCEMDVDECSSEPCHNGAVCRDGIDEYSCYCVPGYQGKHCDLEVNECVSDPCLNGATCLNLIGRYYCICPLGYTGKHCFKQPFLCVMENYYTPFIHILNSLLTLSREPCANPAPALSPAGANCELEVDECQSRPCQNGATCRDAPAAFSCSCPPGYTGSHCETDISECSSAPCAAGRCLERSWAARYGHEPALPPPFRHDRAEGYVCACPPGVRGEQRHWDCKEHFSLGA